MTEIIQRGRSDYRSFFRRLSGLVAISSCDRAEPVILCKQEPFKAPTAFC